jgi:UDP-N-acetyl-D-galactosamine dehydrogenase
LTETPDAESYDGILLAVAHDQFRQMGAPAIRRLGRPVHVLYDLKHLFEAHETDIRL